MDYKGYVNKHYRDKYAKKGKEARMYDDYTGNFGYKVYDDGYRSGGTINEDNNKYINVVWTGYNTTSSPISPWIVAYPDVQVSDSWKEINQTYKIKSKEIKAEEAKVPKKRKFYFD